MNWHSQTVVFCLWGAQPILQAAVAAIFWRRKLYRQFPAFYWFLLAQVANFAVTFPLWLAGSRILYFWFFWLGEAVNAVLGFKVIHEIFLDVFRPYHTLKDLGTLLFKWTGVVLLLLSLVVAFSNSLDHDPLVHALTTLQRSVGVVQLGLILFLLLFSRFLGVSRKQVSFGIALGFGLFAGVDLMLMALNSGGFIAQDTLNLINMATWNMAILIWLGYSLSRKALSQATVNRLQTQRWEQSLAGLQTSEPSDSLIPMFEGMVERALLRNSNLEPGEDVTPLDQSFTRPRTNSAVAGSKTQR
ncbi:MAG: hypothetical protein LAO23_21930 [Acidobacteriia bacterium]|nr:hypothetical protein [Terriglobia bacterium]